MSNSTDMNEDMQFKNTDRIRGKARHIYLYSTKIQTALKSGIEMKRTEKKW